MVVGSDGRNAGLVSFCLGISGCKAMGLLCESLIYLSCG